MNLPAPTALNTTPVDNDLAKQAQPRHSLTRPIV